jgi:dethiobiotin synthetase
MKPVASGAQLQGARLVSEDALELLRYSAPQVPYALVNPYVFAPPIAPHLAAREAGQVIDARVIRQAFAGLQQYAEQIVVEGVGGWRVPLAPGLEVADLPGLLDLPVIMVVGLRLGCLNHALLTVQGIQQRGCRLAGWIANHVDPAFSHATENLATLQERIPAPCLGVIPHQATMPGSKAREALVADLKISWF